MPATSAPVERVFSRGGGGGPVMRPHHRVIYLKETRVRTTHAARKMLLCRLEAAKRHLNPGKIFALARISPRSIRSVCVFSPLTWLVIIDNSLCVCACVCVF